MADKSPRQHMSKKAGKSLKEKRADKHSKALSHTFVAGLGCGVGDGITSHAAIKKQSAPRAVPPFDHVTFTNSPESGSVYAPTADSPKKTEPSMFNVTMVHERSRT